MSGSDDDYLSKSVRPDLTRAARTGTPEVILAEGKTLAQLREAVAAFLAAEGRALVSRLTPDRQAALVELGDWDYDAAARFGVVATAGYEAPAPRGRVGLLAAGTSDLPVAREALLVARALGARARGWWDVGVAGVHRLAGPLLELREWGAHVVVVAAGREGTLPTLVAGLIDQPVIGLPVSQGYGLGGRGEAALYAMLQSCAPLMAVNIDAGLVAGAMAARIARLAEK